MLKSVIKGKVWKFGDNINTDLIMPGHTLWMPPKEAATFCMEAIRPGFAQQVQPGDVIVGGKNFGCGSGRPTGRVLMALGISCAIAESFSRNFFRNSVSLGFPLLYCKGVHDAFTEGDMLQVDFRTGEVKNLTAGKTLNAEPLPEVAMRILNAGGVVALLQEEYAEK